MSDELSVEEQEHEEEMRQVNWFVVALATIAGLVCFVVLPSPALLPDSPMGRNGVVGALGTCALGIGLLFAPAAYRLATKTYDPHRRESIYLFLAAGSTAILGALLCIPHLI